jgi:hypothetical protein
MGSQQRPGAQQAEQRYMQWADALADHFFHDRGPWARPVVLYVDDETAKEIRAEYDLGIDLESAVRSMVYPNAVYQRIKVLSGRSGRRRDRPPASLPLLAATVLAATRMEPSGKPGQPPYYEPLRRLLGTAEAPFGKPSTAQICFPEVVALWKQLRQWADSWDGRRGVLILPGKPRPPRIGYPLSQALIRRTDHEPLAQFFEEEPRTSFWDGQQLLKGLQDWQNSHRSVFSKKFGDQLHSEPLAKTWCDLLEAFRDGRSGGERDPSSLAGGQGSIRVRFDSRSRSLTWIGECSGAGTPDAFEVAGPSGGYGLERVPDSDLYLGLDGLDVTPERLNRGFSLTGEGMSLQRSPARAVPLVRGPDIEGFVEVNAARPFTQCCLLVHSSAVGDVKHLLAHALPGAREIPHKRLPGMPRDWSLFMQIRFEDPVRLEQALSRSRSGLRFDQPRGRMKLSGGLAIRSVPGTRTYLDRGLPEISLSGEHVTGVAIDGRPLSEGLDRMRLRLPEDLPDGAHAVTADNAPLLPFSVHGEAVDKAGPVPEKAQCSMPLGDRSKTETAQGLPGASPRVKGCAIESLPPAALPSVAVAPRNADLLAVAGDGLGTAELRRPDRPQWRERIPELSGSDRFEVEIRNGSGWLVQGTEDSSQLHPFSPAPQTAPPIGGRPDRSPRTLHSPQASAWEAPEEGHGDVLLRWVSELGSGSVTELRNGIGWYAGSHGLPDGRSAIWKWVNAMGALGHLDVAWRSSTWSSSPPVVTRIPYSDGLAAVTGERRRSALKALLGHGPRLGLEAAWVQPPCAQGDLPLPVSLLIGYWSPGQLEELASLTGVAYTPCFALQVAEALPGTQADEPDGGPRTGALVNRYTPPSPSSTGKWTETGDHTEDGLYHWKRTDSRTVFRVRRSEGWFKTSKETGVYAELHRRDVSALSWTQESAPGRWRIGSLAVHAEAPLPQLHARTATLCSGLPARTSPGGSAVYDNVPWRVARAIAESLGQRISVGVRQVAEPRPGADAPPPVGTGPEPPVPGPRPPEQDPGAPAEGTGSAPGPIVRSPRGITRFREQIDLGSGFRVTVDEAELALSRAEADFLAQRRLGERERAKTERMRISQGVREFDPQTRVWIRKVVTEQARETASPTADRMHR